TTALNSAKAEAAQIATTAQNKLTELETQVCAAAKDRLRLAVAKPLADLDQKIAALAEGETAKAREILDQLQRAGDEALFLLTSLPGAGVEFAKKFVRVPVELYCRLDAWIAQLEQSPPGGDEIQRAIAEAEMVIAEAERLIASIETLGLARPLPVVPD